jgi:tRNA pseudouridine55 synthase
VRVTVHQWAVRALAPDAVHVTISCSGGTYVRALARDLGIATDSAAHLVALRRLRSGVFDVADAVTLEQLKHGEGAPRSLREAIPTIPVQPLSDDELRRVLHGNSVSARVAAPVVALLDASHDLVALAKREGETLLPRVVLRDA